MGPGNTHPVTAFASQFDEVDRALFEYRYKQQTKFNGGQRQQRTQHHHHQQLHPHQLNAQAAGHISQGPTMPRAMYSGTGSFGASIAGSPDLFMENAGAAAKHDMLPLNLVSSISSGSSHSSSGELDHITIWPKVSHSIWDPVDKEVHGTGEGGRFQRGEKSFGWLNIWGNDMSVWG